MALKSAATETAIEESDEEWVPVETFSGLDFSTEYVISVEVNKLSKGIRVIANGAVFPCGSMAQAESVFEFEKSEYRKKVRAMQIKKYRDND